MNNNKTIGDALYSKEEIAKIVKERNKWFRERHSELIRNRREYKLTSQNSFK